MLIKVGAVAVALGRKINFGRMKKEREREREREGELLVVPLLHHYLRKRSYYAWDGDFGGGGGRWTKTLFGYRRCAAASLPYSLQ